jgi:hypothetical protein
MDKEAHIPAVYEPIPTEIGMGEAMRQITPQQRAWVLAYVEAGDENATAAARRAQYGKDSHSPEAAKTTQKITGYRLSHEPKIIAAMRELAEDRFRIAGYRATQAMLELVKDPTHKDHFRALERVLAQTGMGVVMQIEHKHTHSLDEREIIKRIALLAQSQGMDPVKLLGSRGVTVDADFEVVTERLTPPAEPAMSSEGLEDLL